MKHRPSRTLTSMSTFRAGAVLVFLATGVLMDPTSGRCQAGKNGSPADPLVSLRVGQWIQLEGTVQADQPTRCTEVRLLAGDYLDDDWSLKGIVQTVDAERREFAVAGCRVQVTENTSFDNPSGTFQGISDLRPGMLVEVEGMYVKDRRFLAAEVDDESDEIRDRPGSKDQIQIVGRVERVDSRKRLIAAMGLVFHMTDRTQVKSVIQ